MRTHKVVCDVSGYWEGVCPRTTEVARQVNGISQLYLYQHLQCNIPGCISSFVFKIDGMRSEGLYSRETFLRDVFIMFVGHNSKPRDLKRVAIT